MVNLDELSETIMGITCDTLETQSKEILITIANNFIPIHVFNSNDLDKKLFRATGSRLFEDMTKYESEIKDNIVYTIQVERGDTLTGITSKNVNDIIKSYWLSEHKEGSDKVCNLLRKSWNTIVPRYKVKTFGKLEEELGEVLEESYVEGTVEGTKDISKESLAETCKNIQLYVFLDKPPLELL